MPKNTLKKGERLSSKILIDSLFSRKNIKSFKAFPFLLLAKEVVDVEDDFPAKVMFSVSKRRIKHAVKRNLVKRRVKEAYRINKHELINHLKVNNKKYILCFIYLNQKPSSYILTEEKIIVLLNRLKNDCA